MRIRIAAVVLMASFSAMALAEDGSALFKTKCAICHGADGQGKPKMGAKLVGTAKTEDQIIALLTKGGAEKGIHVKPMNGLSADQAKAVATYVKSLKYLRFIPRGDCGGRSYTIINKFPHQAREALRPSNQDLSASSARPCHPLPVARSPSTTSGASRIEIGTFRRVFCGPRRRIDKSTFCSAFGSVENGLKRATSSAVISLTSPFSSINGLRFAIEFSLPLVGLAETDDADTVWFGNVAEQVQPLVQIPYGNASNFALAGIVRDQCRLEIEVGGPLE